MFGSVHFVCHCAVAILVVFSHLTLICVIKVLCVSPMLLKAYVLSMQVQSRGGCRNRWLLLIYTIPAEESCF